MAALVGPNALTSFDVVQAIPIAFPALPARKCDTVPGYMGLSKTLDSDSCVPFVQTRSTISIHD